MGNVKDINLEDAQKTLRRIGKRKSLKFLKPFLYKT